MLYIKEIENVKEIFNDKYPIWLNYIIYFIKYIFCVLTIKNNNCCYIPYKKLKNKYIIKIIIKMLEKENYTIVFSKQLLENPKFIIELNNKNINFIKSINLFNYAVLEILKYISRMKQKSIKETEVSVLVSSISSENISLLYNLAINVKRLNIVTTRSRQVKKIRRRFTK